LPLQVTVINLPHAKIIFMSAMKAGLQLRSKSRVEGLDILKTTGVYWRPVLAAKGGGPAVLPLALNVRACKSSGG
jgi:hypothetical protein